MLVVGLLCMPLSVCVRACVFTCAQIRHGVNRGGHGRFDGPSSEVCLVVVVFLIPSKPAVKSAALLNLKSHFQIDTLPLPPSSPCLLSSLCHLFEQSETIRAHNSESRVCVCACSVVVLFPPPPVFSFLVISLSAALFHTITQHGSSGRLHFGTLGYSNTPPVCLVSVSPE